MAGSRSADVKTPKARLSFANDLFKPKENDRGTKQWGCTLLFPKGTDLSALEKAALEAAQAEWGDKAAQWIKDQVIKSPFLDGDGPQGISKKTGERREGYAGHKFIRCTSGEEYRPKLFNQKVLPITSADELPSGVHVFAVVNAFTWDTKENGKGITFGVSMVQKAGDDGTRYAGGGGGDPTEHFEAIPDEGDAPASTKTGEGAAGLFG